MKVEKLTIKQKTFSDYYIQTGNGTEAAKLAGYSEKTAKVIAAENLTKPNIRSYIEERLAPIEGRRIATGDDVLEYLTRVMNGEEKDSFGLDTSISDRNKAAELLGKRLLLWKEQIDVSGTVNVAQVLKEAQERAKK